jgi:hypothetical protein
MKKVLIISLIMILGLPLLGIATSYCIFFLPHLSELHVIEKEGAAIVFSAPPILYQIAVAAESKEGIRTYAMKQACWYVGCKEKPQRMLAWHFNGALYLISSYLHFSDEQVFSLWTYYAPYERGRGLGNAALNYYEKPLSELNEQQLASLVVAVRSPSRYKPGTERSERRVKEILKKVKKS